MKPFFAMATVFFLLVSFCGCSSGDTGDISFYYCRSPEQYRYFEEDGVICAESRDLMGHRQDLQYLVGLYLAGPLDEQLISPFPKSVRLLSANRQNDSICIELTDHSSDMSDSEFSLACACLTLTCIRYTGCSSVTVVSGARSYTMDMDSILLYDPLPQQETIGG